MNTIGRNIQTYLDLYNMSRIDFARSLEVTPTAVGSWIKGTRVPRASYINRMCEIFRCSISDIMDEPKPAEAVESDLLLQRIIDFAGRLNNDGKEKVLSYMQDLSGRFLK